VEGTVNIVGLRDRLAVWAGREGGGWPHREAAGKQNRGTGELGLPAQESLLVHLHLFSPFLLGSPWYGIQVCLDTRFFRSGLIRLGEAHPVCPLRAPLGGSSHQGLPAWLGGPFPAGPPQRSAAQASAFSLPPYRTTPCGSPPRFLLPVVGDPPCAQPGCCLASCSGQPAPPWRGAPLRDRPPRGDGRTTARPA